MLHIMETEGESIKDIWLAAAISIKELIGNKCYYLYSYFYFLMLPCNNYIVQ